MVLWLVFDVEVVVCAARFWGRAAVCGRVVAVGQASVKRARAGRERRLSGERVGTKTRDVCVE